jgi:Arc/MetJ-type ribon-helix-helix transcriptional regulator
MSGDDTPIRSAGSPVPVRTRRRSPAADPLRKTTVQMHTSVLDAVRQAVEHGYAASQNEFVEEAVLARLRELRRARVYAAYDEAARDPEFMAEMRRVTEEFDHMAADGLEPA